MKILVCVEMTKQLVPKKLKSKVKYLLMLRYLNFYEHQPRKSNIHCDLLWSLDEYWFFLFLSVLFSPDSLLGCLLLVLLLEYGELVGEVLLADSHGVAPHVCILSNTNKTTQRNKGTYGKVVESRMGKVSVKWRNPFSSEHFETLSLAPVVTL